MSFVSNIKRKTHENTIKSPKSMHFFTLFKGVQLPGLEPLVGRFWPLGLMFDAPFLNGSV